MSSLLYLSDNDFHIQKGQKGAILCNSIKGFSLVMYFSTRCQHCHHLIPLYKQLPGTIGGCQFALVNISNSMQIIQMAKQTIVPIKYVPCIILYYNGIPLAEYKGDKTQQGFLDNIRQFIVNIATQVQKRQQFANEERSRGGNKKIGAEYDYLKGIGVPVCDGDKCYLAFDNEGGYHNNTIDKVCYVKVDNTVG